MQGNWESNHQKRKKQVVKKAREALAIAKEMIGRMGYHRRDGEVKELEGQL